MCRNFCAAAPRVDFPLSPVDDGIVDAVFDELSPALYAPEPLRVALVLGEEQLRRSLAR